MSSTEDQPKPGDNDSGAKTVKGVTLTTDLSAFVTVTSSTANGIIDSASVELSKRIAKQLEEITLK
jgi:hypothetical protein